MDALVEVNSLSSNIYSSSASEPQAATPVHDTGETHAQIATVDGQITGKALEYMIKSALRSIQPSL